MDRLEGLIEQVVEQKHVHAAPAEEGLDDAEGDVGAPHFLMLEVDEDRLALRRKLRLGSEPPEERVDTRVDGHEGRSLEQAREGGCSDAIDNGQLTIDNEQQ